MERVEHCSGTALSEEWVLSTASCFLNRWTNLRQFQLDIKVRFGANSTNGNSASYGVRDVIFYPGFSDANDIALVRLAGPIRHSWDGRLITPVCLPPYNPYDVYDDDVVGHDAMIMGWTDAAQFPPAAWVQVDRAEKSDVTSYKVSGWHPEAHFRLTLHAVDPRNYWP